MHIRPHRHFGVCVSPNQKHSHGTLPGISVLLALLWFPAPKGKRVLILAPQLRPPAIEGCTARGRSPYLVWTVKNHASGEFGAPHYDIRAWAD